MLKRKVKRPGDWPAIPATLRDRAKNKYCLVCARRYKEIVYEEFGPKGKVFHLVEHIDHIFPRRWLAESFFDPNIIVNLISICSACHGRKKNAEDRLYQGDALYYVQRLYQLGWPMHRVRVAAQAYGIREILNWMEGMNL